jgi:hypothetical protein
MSNTRNDLKNLSYRMTTQLNLAMNDLKNVKKNIKQINNIIKHNSERKIEDLSEKNEIISNDEYKNDDPPRAGITTNQHNMSHNRWMSSLRNRFSNY